MFRGGAANPYDDIVAKTTDENLTSENWELIMNLCDKVLDEGDQGARNVIAAILKRLAHRNANVQLYSLALVEALSKNCTVELHREIASRAFTQALEKLITDRTTHDKVRQRALSLIALWTAEWENDPSLGIMEECYNNLKAKHYKFDTPQEPPPPDVDAEVRRREEEELQRALEISVQDKGGRSAWGAYSLASSSGAGASGSQNGHQASAASSSSALPTNNPAPASYASGYSPAPARSDTVTQPHQTSATPGPVGGEYASYSAVGVTPASPSPSVTSVVTRVRALHTFEPTEPGELAFEKGDIIKVVDRGYKDWWRGQLKGRTGIFPVNYVEPLPEPTAAELAAEAQQESAVFSQAANVDRLLTMLRTLDPAKDNLADNEEIQELYRSSMALRPKIVKLIDKYSQKRADLVAMNESFVKARTIFDRMMEESLARHSGFYDQRPPYAQAQPSYQARPGSAQGGYGHGAPPQSYGWNPSVYDQPGYNAYPAPASAYAPGQEGTYPAPQAQPPEGPNAPYGSPQPSAQGQGQAYAQPPPAQGPYPQQPYAQGFPQPAQSTQGLPQYQSAPGQPDPNSQYGQPHPQSQPQPQPQAQPQVQGQLQGQPQPQAQGQPQPQAQFQPQPEPQAQPQSQSPQQQVQQQPAHQQPPPQQGPPYVYDPNGTYPDSNAQAWAQYYAQGGKDPTGAVYFLSVPGITDGGSQSPVAPAHAQQEQQQPQPQPQSQATQPQPQPQPQQTQPQPQSQLTRQESLPLPYPGPQSRQGTTSELANWAGPPQAQAQAQPQQQQPHSPGAGGIGGAFTQAIQQQQHQLHRQGSLVQSQSPSSPTLGAQAYPGQGAGAGAYAPVQTQSPAPYGAPGQHADGWQGQYQGLQSQFAGMHVGGGEGPAGGAPEPGQQVGA
ncbi:hypothetical protein DENSPDRAFT_863919 [Dentipellis sp. KUC8613]|nr:hypothetical protein DENSPDRAFT_863919 [Dentipellis sp. KUC8613]